MLPGHPQHQTRAEAWDDHKAYREGIGNIAFGDGSCGSDLSQGSQASWALSYIRVEEQQAWKCVKTLLCWSWSENINLELKKVLFFSFLKPDIHFKVNNLKPFKTWCENLMLSFVITEIFIENVWS